jgi:hypothetical protein
LSEGKPIVVTDVRIQGQWDAQYFMERYDDTVVNVEDCETGKAWKSTLRSFFEKFLEHDEGLIWKLKVGLFTSLSPFVLTFGMYRIGHRVRTSNPNFLNCSMPSCNLFHVRALFGWMAS